MVWDEILGHEKAKRFLQQLVKAKQRPHAFLFCGPSGIGKKLLAQMFAKTLLCTSGEEACGKCASCNYFSRENHPDYFMIQPDLKADGQTRKDSIAIAQVRDLLKEAAFLPKLGDNRVAIIDDAHLMTQEAANSLLKLLEEPPSGWVFILIASSQENILPTILSRVTIVKLAGLKKEEIVSYFKTNSIQLANAQIAASLADGSIGKALYFADNQAEETRQEAAGFLKAAIYGEHLKAATFVKKIPKEKAILACEYMATFLRDVWRIKISDAENIWNRDLLNVLDNISRDLSIPALKKILQHVEQAIDSIKRAANPQLAMEGLYILIGEEK